MPAAPLLIVAFLSIPPGRAIRRPVIRWAGQVSSSIPLELRTPPPTLRWVGTDLSFVLFHDMGNAFQTSSQVWPSALRIKQPHSYTCRNVTVPYTTYNTPDTCDFNDFSHALGLGLRYHTPIGPVRGDFSYNLNPPIYPVFVRLHHGGYGSEPARRFSRALQLFLQHRTELLMLRRAPKSEALRRYSKPKICASATGLSGAIMPRAHGRSNPPRSDPTGCGGPRSRGGGHQWQRHPGERCERRDALCRACSHSVSIARATPPNVRCSA